MMLYTYVSLSPPSLLLLLAAVAFTAAAAGVSQLDPLRSGSNLGFWFPCRRTIYNMCTQKLPHDYSQQLYDKYQESFEEYITSIVSRLFISLLLM